MNETQQLETNLGGECTTKVNLRLSGERTVISIRIKPEIKEAFTDCCRQLGLSTCHVAEGLFSGFIYGVNENQGKVNLSRTAHIDLTLVRDVKRIRRYAVEEIIGTQETQNGSCVVCGRKAFAVVTRKDSSRVLLCKIHYGLEKRRLTSFRVLEAVQK